MRNIPLAAIPNQSLSIRIGNQRLVLRIKEANGVMVADLDRNEVRVISGVRVLAGEPIIPYKYLEDGNFLLLTINGGLPEWRQFNATQNLVFITAEEIASWS